MAGYVQPSITTNPDALVATAFDTLMTAFPSYVPNESTLEAWIVEVVARMNAVTRDVASNVPTSIFRYFGQQLMNIAPIAAAAATVNATWTMDDTAGYTVPAGTVAGFPTAAGPLIAFMTTSDIVIAPGTSTGTSVMQAVIAGTDGNGFTGNMQLIDSLAFVTSVVATTTSSEGVDPEQDDAYLARLTSELQLMAPRPILPNDFAVLAQNVAGVTRALAVDGYNPGDGTTTNERMVAVSPVDATGAACSTPVKTALQTYLQSKREINFIVNVFDPTFTVIDVVTTFAAKAGQSTGVLQTNVAAAITSYLSPATWAGGDQSPPAWLPGIDMVRYLELAAVIGAVPGVAYIETLHVYADVPAWAATTVYALNAVVKPTVANGFTYKATTAGTSGSAQPVWPTVVGATVADGTAVWTCQSTSSDVALAGHAPLPSVGAISATVA